MKKQAAKSNGTIWNRVYTCVFCANVLLFLGMQMVNTLVAKYADALGAAPTIVGVVSSLFALTALIFKIFSGPAIDAFNRKYILMGAILVIAISFAGFSMSVNVEMLFAFRLLQGCGQAFTATCCLALAADALPADRFGVGIGTFTLAQAVCQAIGPTIGLTLAERVGYRSAFAVAACCTFCAVGAAALIRTPQRERGGFRISLGSIVAPEAVFPAVLLFLLQMTFCNINSFLVIYADQQNVSNIGFFYTVYAIAMLFAPRTVGKLADRWGTTKAIVPAMLCFALSFLIISYATALPVFLLAAVISAFGYGAAQPAVQALGMKCVPEARRGSASSTSYIGQDLGNLAGPIVAGWIVERMGYNAMWRMMILPVLAAILITLLCRGRITRIETEFRERTAGKPA
ncbi:MAG: MFS transporter [Candidatus Onthomonas sp.]